MSKLKIITQNNQGVEVGTFANGFEHLLKREIELERTNWNNLYAHITWDDGTEETYDFVLWRYQNGCGRYHTYTRKYTNKDGMTDWKEVPNASSLPVVTPGHTNPTWEE